MSQQSAYAARQIINQLLEARGVSRDILSDIGRAETDAYRLLGIASQLTRGDISGLVSYLAMLGPKGAALAAAIGVAFVGYHIYQTLTTPKPTEVYIWRYPK